jgi:pyruvate kinase
MMMQSLSPHPRSFPRRTKIISTIGPASSRPETIAALICAGVNVFRVNASHGEHSVHLQAIQSIREQARLAEKAVGILLDLQGPKIRVGEFDGPPKVVQPGELVHFSVRREAAAHEIPADYEHLDRDVEPGQPLLIDDGQISMVVEERENGLVVARAINGGCIKPRKGINLPKSKITAPAITHKDHEDIRFAVEAKVDFIALSFVRHPTDVMLLKTILQELNSQIPIIAKIEKPQALQHLDEIIQAAWGVMVARGDLGVEISNEEVPIAQKRIIASCIKHYRPVITATQMLDSMTHQISPTRAEASDVANAVLDGTDAVMLSQETAVGQYPVETVMMMARIIDATEKSQRLSPSMLRRRQDVKFDIPEAIAWSGCDTASNLNASAVVVYTETGRMALAVAQRRIFYPIIAITYEYNIYTRLSLIWNIVPYFAPERPKNTTERLLHLDKTLLTKHLVQHGNVLILLIGGAHAPSGSTNLLMVHKVGDLKVPV